MPHRLRRLRLWLFGLIAVLVIVMGLLVGATQLILPWVASHPEKIGAMLSERLDRPVTIDRLDARWERYGPLLTLTGVHIGASATDAQALTIPRAGIKFNYFSWLRRNGSFTEFRLDGLALELEHSADGRWQVRGFSGGDDAQPTSLDDNPLFSLGTLVLRDAKLTIDDVASNKHFPIGADELRLINKGDLHRVLARVRCLDTPSMQVIDAVIEYDSGDHSGRAYLGGKDMDLAALIGTSALKGLVAKRGKGDVQIWAWLENGGLSQARAEVSLSDLVLSTQSSIALDDKRDIAPTIGFERIAFGARWQQETDGWSADVADLQIVRQGIAAPAAQAHLRKRNAVPAVRVEPLTEADAEPGSDGTDTRSPEYTVAVGALDLSPIASVAMLFEAPPVAIRRWLYAGNPEGVVTRATLRYTDAQNYDIAAQLDALTWHAVDRLPGVAGFSGLVLGDQDAVAIDLPQHDALAVSVPHVFRQALDFSEFAGSVAAYRTGADWRIETDALNFEGGGPGKNFSGQISGAVDIPGDGAKPSLDLAALIAHADVVSSHLFWPLGNMSPRAMEWLDRALDSGRVVNGRAVIRGNLADWPFHNNAGRFEAVAEIEDLRFKYLGDWPALEHGHALATFVNTSLHVDVDGASVQGNAVEKAGADISDYGEGTLDVHANAQGSGHDLFAFVKASPLGARYAGPLEGIEVGGQGKVDFNLHAPMKPIENYTIDGNAQLTDADLTHSTYKLKFDKASGPLRFNRSGFAADELATTFHDKPAKLSIAIGGFVADAAHAVEVKIASRLPIGDVMDYVSALNDYKKYASGEAQWNALFSVDQDAKGDSGKRITLTSDLRGVRIDLPQPLAKTADAAMPLKLALGVPFDDLDLRLADILRMRGRITAPFAALIDFGGEAAAALPKAGITIGGNARSVDLSGWMDFATSGSGGSDGGILNRIDLRTPALSVWDRNFGDSALKLSTSADAIDLTFNGTNLDGSLNIPRGAGLRQRGITADFRRLYWPEAPEPDPNAPVTEANSALNPTSVPPLHIRVDDFHLGKANYGQATVESVPIVDGMHIDPMTTHSKNIDMRARGDWTLRNGYQRSTFGIDLSAQNIGNMLDALGNGNFIDGGKTVAHIDASWAGAPSQFALNKINGGAVKVKIEQGQIPEFDPGAGRLAGLLNLAAIPRRLAFDFGDLFNKGYSFDSIAGTFTMTDGYAYTEDLEVKSPTADMKLKGSVGLKTRDWDQIVEVTPHVSSTILAGGGALVGGPIGAAAGLLVGTVFKNQLNAATRFEYKVTGSWDKPNIARVGSTSASPKKPAAAAPATKQKSN